MTQAIHDLGGLIEPDRVHRSVYTDPAIFEREMETIFHRVWTYVGHESQVPKPGDYYTMLIGRQPMVMVRHQDGAIHVLYNRCAHRGAMVCGALHGNTGKSFTCSYHSWQYHTDGTLESIPLPKGYEGTRLSPEPRVQHEARGARRDLPRLRVREPRGGGPLAPRMARRRQDRLRRHVQPRARGRSRGRPELFPRDPALQLEDLPRESARRTASVGDARVHGPRGARGRARHREEERQGAARLSLPL